MSKLFFDRLVELSEVDKQIKKIAKTKEEREELWILVDEIIHHKVIGCILDKLPRGNHEEFLEKFSQRPHDEEYIFGYLRQKVGDNVESIIKKEIDNLSAELLEEIHS